MREMALPGATNFAENKDRYTLLERARKRWLIAFFFCTTLGAAMGVTGMLLSLLGSFHFFEVGIFLDRVDTGLIATAFPIVVFAAHCLDKAEAAKKKLKAITYQEYK